MLRTFFIATVLCFVSNTGLAAERTFDVKRGFLTGSDFSLFSELQKEIYMVGFVNGLLMAPLMYAPKEKTAWIEDCAENMESGRLVLSVNKNIEDNPSLLNAPMNSVSYSTLRKICK